MDRKAIRKFANEKQRRINKSIQLLEKGDVDGAKNQIEWVKTADQLVEFHKNKQKYIWSIIFVIICIVLVGLSCTLRISKVSVLFDLYLDGLVFSLQDEWKVNDQVIADAYYINNLQQVSTDEQPAEFIEKPSDTSFAEVFDMSIEGERVKLTQFELPSNTLIELEINPNQLQIYAKGSQLSGRFSIRRGQAVINGEEQQYNIPINLPPSTISFKTIKTNYDYDPIRFDLNGNHFWEFTNLRVNSLNFYRENPPNSGSFESTIESGKISIYESESQIILTRGEALSIEIASNRSTSIKKLEDKFHLSFEGEVMKIIAGPEGFEKNLKPTLLEYFYYNKRLTFLWSAIVFIWGLLWSIRNTLFRKIL